MIINSTPDNKATFAGVSQVSEFKIRNSAKAFGILSSGLYANKIRAIIRELSCNALDSHVAAGKRDVPFDLHLPTFLEPYFSIRDYGTGLNHSEVLNIYTTYFESTKTASNDFIGALGLGSKSPFSYTDNFTVIAIKNGIKGIYSAFINDDGVPAIALMGQEESTEETGVEVRFAVTNKEDYDNFRHETRSVFRYFPLRPKLNIESLTFDNVEYEEENIIPNVHRRKSRHNSENRAIMGNISYPIELPRGSLSSDELMFIDGKSLDLYFDIGEIDFQASREGLQYTARTIAAIEQRYQALFDILYNKVKTKYNAIKCEWAKAEAIIKDASDSLLHPYATEYVKREKPGMVEQKYRSPHWKTFELNTKKLKDDFNIALRVFRTDRTWSNANSTDIMTAPETTIRDSYHFTVRERFVFLDNSKNEKIWERARWHFKTQVEKVTHVIVLYAADPTKEVLVDKFYKMLYNPPAANRMTVDQLAKKERIVGERDYQKMNILRLYVPRYDDDVVWSTVPITVDSVKDKTVCWFPLKGYVTSIDDKIYDAKEIFKLHYYSRGLTQLKDVEFVGVRQGEMAAVSELPTWKRFDVFFKELYNNLGEQVFLRNVTSNTNYSFDMINHEGKLRKLLDNSSPFAVFLDKLGAEKIEFDVQQLVQLFGWEDDVKSKLENARKEEKEIAERYPMLIYVRDSYRNYTNINADYIKLVDQMKGQI
jgi:hypothetical protein